MPRARVTQPIGPDTAVFGARLQELREKRGMTLRTLAETARMSLTYLSDLERGLKVPTLRTLLRLAVALDCKLSALVSVFDKTDIRGMLSK